MTIQSRVTWSCQITLQINIIKYSRYQNVYGYPPQGGDIKSGVSFHKFTKLFDHVILQNYVRYQIYYITTTVKLMATKLEKVVTYDKKLRPISLSNPGHVVTSDHGINLKHCISTTIMSMISKSSKLVTCHQEIPSIKSHDPLITKIPKSQNANV